MPVTAAISAGATLAGAAISSSAAKSAAKTQANAAGQATQVQQDMYNQTRADLAPFRDLGSGAGSALSKLLGIGATPTAAPQVGGANYAAYVQSNPDLLAAWNSRPELQAAYNGDMAAWGENHYTNGGKAEGRAVPTYTANDVANYRTPQEQALESLPGYQFAKTQGIQSVNRSLGSMGLTGAQAKGISRFVTGLADQTYNSQVKNLQDLTNTGENASAQTGSIGQAYGSNIGNNIVGAGTASASGTIGAANAASGALGQIPSYLLANKLLGGGGSSAASGIYGAGIGATDAALGG